MPAEEIPVDDERHVRPFAEFLVEQRGGLFHAELSAEWVELVTAVRGTGKAGELVIKLKVSPKSSYLVVADDIGVKAPKPDRDAEAIWFADTDGNLVREDPRQPKLPLRAVERERRTAEGAS